MVNSSVVHRLHWPNTRRLRRSTDRRAPGKEIDDIGRKQKGINITLLGRATDVAVW